MKENKEQLRSAEEIMRSNFGLRPITFYGQQILKAMEEYASQFKVHPYNPNDSWQHEEDSPYGNVTQLRSGAAPEWTKYLKPPFQYIEDKGMILDASGARSLDIHGETRLYDAPNGRALQHSFAHDVAIAINSLLRHDEHESQGVEGQKEAFTLEDMEECWQASREHVFYLKDPAQTKYYPNFNEWIKTRKK